MLSHALILQVGSYADGLKTVAEILSLPGWRMVLRMGDLKEKLKKGQRDLERLLQRLGKKPAGPALYYLVSDLQTLTDDCFYLQTSKLPTAVVLKIEPETLAFARPDVLQLKASNLRLVPLLISGGEILDDFHRSPTADES